jgi:tRNA (cmo5U34)-methyltransferase
VAQLAPGARRLVALMGQFHWDPASYLELMCAEVPSYDELQAAAVAACAGGEVASILELGTGTGETARRLLAAHPEARLTGIDASDGMLSVARDALADFRVELSVGRLEDPLPGGPFDLVVSVVAVHPPDAAGKAGLFRRVATVLAPGGCFVLGDVIVPEDPADVVTPIDGVYDQPSRIEEQLSWLAAAGFDATVRWRHRDLAVLAATLP